jgi:hypothetical protein
LRFAGNAGLPGVALAKLGVSPAEGGQKPQSEHLKANTPYYAAPFLVRFALPPDKPALSANCKMKSSPDVL